MPNYSRALRLGLGLFLAAHTIGAADEDHVRRRKLSNSKSGGGSIFLQGDLGTPKGIKTAITNGIGGAGGVTALDDDTLLSATKTSLASILRSQMGGTGGETWKPGRHNNRVVRDDNGNQHIRYEQTYQGLPVADSAMVVHMDANGKVYAVNGEFIVEGTVDMRERLTCDEVFANVLNNPEYGEDAKWLSDCKLKVIMDKKGDGHKTWERMVGYQPEDGPYQKDKLYASVVTGEIVAVRPTVMGALKLRTNDCKQKYSNCKAITTSTSAITYTKDKAIEAAHNYARATYLYYYNNFGRDSINNAGMQITSNVHVGVRYNNAYWDGSTVNYGDGDGYWFTAFSKDADVVAHEISHGVTQYTSGLVYQDESGALNEAMSDIFGACVDRSLGASVTDTWTIGEGIFTPGTTGDGLRYMSNPGLAGDYDYYPTRYIGTSDRGGVHSNSGIMNLAFYLMVAGGTHPLAKTSVVVKAIDSDFDTSIKEANKIFYKAQTACLTPRSGFVAARICTILHAGDHADSVAAAWDAVGVGTTTFSLDTPVTELSAPQGTWKDFVIDDVPANTAVTCSLNGANGDADLVVALRTDDSRVSTCSSLSYTSVESCKVGTFSVPSKLQVTIQAYYSYSGLTLTCTQAPVRRSLLLESWSNLFA